MSIPLDEIRTILIEEIPINHSGGEVALSVGEGLLLVLDACKKGKVAQSTMDKLNKLYIEGVQTEDDAQFIAEIKELLADKNFVVKSDPRTVNQDPTRRYFETHLSYQILKNNGNSLNNKELNAFTQNLKKRIFSLPGVAENTRKKIEAILNGNMDEKILTNKYELEYAELINRLLKNDYYGLSKEACKNLYEIACSTILATFVTQLDKSVPVDIYSDSIFNFGMDGRGRVVKVEDNEKVLVHAKGLMQAVSPLPLYHDLANPVTDYRNEEERSFILRSADQASFMIESDWSQQLFSRQTQVYSNGISSTTLAQLRIIVLQKRLGLVHHSGSLQEYITAFATLMLYNSGGHSFFEIFEVLKLPHFQELTDGEPVIARAIAENNLMYKLLCEDQKASYDEALAATQKYARVLLNKKIMHAQLKQKDELGLNEPKRKKTTTIFQAVVDSDSKKFDKVLSGLDKKEINKPNAKKFTPLMVAAQLGKQVHVEKLINAGANINFRPAGGYTSLELAIKSQKYATVETLLKAGAFVKRTTRPGAEFKLRAPALYLACRQHDMRILNAVLEQKNSFNIIDKKDAILVALRIENLEALRILMKSVSRHEKRQYFTDEFKSQLLKEAVGLGNPRLIQEIIDLNWPASSSKQINYELLMNNAAAKGFLPTARELLNLFHKNPKNKGKSINLDKALIDALKNHHFDVAVFLIIHGANPEIIPNNGKYLRSFDAYLQNTTFNTLFFLRENKDLVAKRALVIEQAFNKRSGNSVLNVVIKHLVNFLNMILPNNWRLGYNDKTNVMGNLTGLFKAGSEKKPGALDKLEKIQVDYNSAQKPREIQAQKKILLKQLKHVVDEHEISVKDKTKVSYMVNRKIRTIVNGAILRQHDLNKERAPTQSDPIRYRMTREDLEILIGLKKQKRELNCHVIDGTTPCSVEDFLTNLIKNGPERTQLIFKKTGSEHWSVMDIQRDKKGKLKIFFLDAIGEQKNLAVVLDFCRRHNIEISSAMGKLQKDYSSCSIFSIEHAFRMSKMTDLHQQIDKIKKKSPNAKFGFDVDSADLPPILVKNAQSATFIQEYLKKHPEHEETKFGRKGLTLRQYVDMHQRVVGETRVPGAIRDKQERYRNKINFYKEYPDNPERTKETRENAKKLIDKAENDIRNMPVSFNAHTTLVSIEFHNQVLLTQLELMSASRDLMDAQTILFYKQTPPAVIDAIVKKQEEIAKAMKAQIEHISTDEKKKPKKDKPGLGFFDNYDDQKPEDSPYSGYLPKL